MKKLLSIFLSMVMILTLFAGCDQGANQPTAPQEPEKVKLWYAYNTESIMQTESYPELMAGRDSSLTMHGIKGEVESAQLIITPTVDVESFDFTVTDLVNENGKKLKKGRIEIFAEWYVEVYQTYNMQSFYGDYADGLIPMKALKKARLNTIVANENQGIWLNVNIPQDADPGTYTGTGTLVLDEEKYEIPISVTVYDVTIPEVVHPKSCFLIWYDMIQIGEGYYDDTLGQAYFDFILEKRCTPCTPIPSIHNSQNKYVEWVVQAAENPKITCYCLPDYMKDSDIGQIVDEDAVMRTLTALAQKNVELRQAGNETIDLFKKAYYYIMDEPAGDALPRVRECDLIVSRCKFAVADAYLQDYPDLYHSLISLSHLVTTGYADDLAGTDTTGGVQTWCPQFQHWHTEEQRQEYYDRKNTPDRLGGEQAWWYGCNNPKAPFPTYHLDDDLGVPRVISWMQYDYEVDGNLYWCVNNWTYESFEYWEEAYIYGDGAVSEGKLLYPGERFGIAGPLSTLRLESIREGQEDYEYLWMIEQKILEYNEANGTDYDPDELMAWIYEGLYKGAVPTRGNAPEFHARRLELLKALELIMNDPAAGIELLKSK